MFKNNITVLSEIEAVDAHGLKIPGSITGDEDSALTLDSVLIGRESGLYYAECSNTNSRKVEQFGNALRVIARTTDDLIWRECPLMKNNPDYRLPFSYCVRPKGREECRNF
jgi:hypothetical protein